MATIYYDKDADLKALKGETVAVIGYGIQGRGQGLNLRDSGLNVLIAQRPGGANHALATDDGLYGERERRPYDDVRNVKSLAGAGRGVVKAGILGLTGGSSWHQRS